MTGVCPLCGETFRGLLDESDFKAYVRTNARVDLCKVGDPSDGYWVIHTDPDEEWLTPPEYVLKRTLHDIPLEAES